MGVKIAGATAAGTLGRRKDVTECIRDCPVKQNLLAFSRLVGSQSVLCGSH